MQNNDDECTQIIEIRRQVIAPLFDMRCPGRAERERGYASKRREKGCFVCCNVPERERER
jgi:hypothetical protein